MAGGTEQEVQQRLQAMDESVPKELRDELKDTFDETQPEYHLPFCLHQILKSNILKRRKRITGSKHSPSHRQHEAEVKYQERIYKIIGFSTTSVQLLILGTISVVSSVHFGVNIPDYVESPGYVEDTDKTSLVVIIIYVQIFFALIFQTMFVVGLVWKSRTRFLKYQCSFQLFMATTLLIDVCFAASIDFGGSEDQYFFAVWDPKTIRFLMALCLCYMVISLWFHMLLKPIVRFLRDLQTYRLELRKRIFKYQKRVFYDLVNVLCLNMQKRLLAAQALENKYKALDAKKLADGRTAAANKLKKEAQAMKKKAMHHGRKPLSTTQQTPRCVDCTRHFEERRIRTVRTRDKCKDCRIDMEITTITSELPRAKVHPGPDSGHDGYSEDIFQTETEFSKSSSYYNSDESRASSPSSECHLDIDKLTQMAEQHMIEGDSQLDVHLGLANVQTKNGAEPTQTPKPAPAENGGIVKVFTDWSKFMGARGARPL